MGTPKQLLPLSGRPLLEHVVVAACASQLDEVLVVLGADHERIRTRVCWGRASVTVNHQHALGLSSSLRAGLSTLGEGVSRAMVILGDQPDITPQLIDLLLQAHTASGRPAAALSLDGLLHPPVVLARELWAEVGGLRGDVGWRHLLRDRPELVTAMAVETTPGRPVDIDTPDDWRRYLASASGPGS